jgi:pimeloyl-ACP methyl ester carboxylesterase
MIRAFAAAAAALACAGPAAAQTTVPDSVYTAPQRLVAVEQQRQLNLFCAGAGEPAVVLEAGAGNGMVTWRFVQAELAKVTKVCAYDRAGLGFSDPADDRASDVKNLADDLFRLIDAAGIAKPFILVGHSLGGEIATLYAASHPDDLAGMVLVEPGFANDLEALQAALPPEQRTVIQDSMARSLIAKRACLDLAEAGKLAPPTTAQARACLDVSRDPNRLNYVLAAASRKQLTEASVWDAQLSEMSAFVPEGDHMDADSAELAAAPFDFGAKPLVVLSRGVDEGGPGVPTEALPRVEAVWRSGHAALAARSTRGVHITVPGARHYVQIDKPQSVIDAVKRVVAEAKGR